MDEGERQLDINTMASEYKFIYSMYTAEKQKKKNAAKIFSRRDLRHTLSFTLFILATNRC